MTLRRTRTIVTDVKSGDEVIKIQLEADVIMTAAILGLAATTIQAQKQNKDSKVPMGIRFDMDPKDKDSNSNEWDTFKETVAKMNRAVADYMEVNTKTLVNAGLSEAFAQGAVIMGVYNLAGHTAPPSVQTPSISAEGKSLYDKISKDSLGGTPMYVGRGAYTGFVDNYLDYSKKPPENTAVGRYRRRALSPHNRTRCSATQSKACFIHDGCHQMTVLFGTIASAWMVPTKIRMPHGV